jgi:hypothetical protein
MKKLFRLTLLLTSFTYKSFSQDKLTFKVAYKPSTKYSQAMTQSSSTEVTYSGSEEFLKTLQERGVQNPTITKTESTTESEFNAGKLTDATNFPVTMKFIKTISSDGKVPIPDGTVIYGKGSLGNMPTLDSIASTELSEEYKASLLQMLKSTFSQISFPEKELKIGEDFAQETPLSIPIAGINIDMTIKTNYKLVSIKNGVGNFDISQTYSLKTNDTKYPINASGKGKGSLQYEIASSNYTHYQIGTEIEINMKLEKFSLDVKSKSGFIQTTAITKY